MKARNHDNLMSWPHGYFEDFYREDRHPNAESIRTAVETTLTTSRADAIVRDSGSASQTAWPEDDPEGLQWKVSEILRLFQSRPATGAVEEFFVGERHMERSKYVSVTVWDHSVKHSTPENPACYTTVYHVDELPLHYQGYELPYASRGLQIRALFTFGVGD
jgi:hypothetical protein